MKPNYYFWTLADGAYGAMMELCVSSARQAGVWKEFRVLMDRPLENCEKSHSLSESDHTRESDHTKITTLFYS